MEYGEMIVKWTKKCSFAAVSPPFSHGESGKMLDSGGLSGEDGKVHQHSAALASR